MSAPFISIYLADRCVGFALNEGPKGGGLIAYAATPDMVCWQDAC